MISLTTSRKDLLNPEGFEINVPSLLLSTLAINILSLAMPVMTLQVYDRILPNPGSGTLPVLVTGVCVAIVLEAVLRLARAYVMSWSGAAYEHRLSCAAMNRVLQADLSRLGRFGIGENLHRMAAIGKLKDFYNGYALVTLAELVFVPVFIGVIIYIAGPLAVVPTAILMIFTLVSLAQGQSLRAALKQRDESDDERYNFLIEGLEGVHTLKSFALEDSFSRRYESLEEKSSLANYRVTESTAGTFNSGAIFSHIMVGVIIAIGALFALQGQITTGALIATVLLSGRMMQPIQRALALWTKYQDYTLARNKAESIFELPRHIPVNVLGTQGIRDGNLALQDVSFRYRESEPWMLDGVSMKLKHGDSVLLSHNDDTAKAALLDLMAGIYPPGQGEIMIDGVNIMRYTPEELINHVGYVQMEGLIFRGTIRDNMTCFGQISEEKAQDMAALLRVTRDIAKLPSGFDTFLSGNSTDNVPPGLKQRIAMVRVLAPRPRIILFDNADKALDREGYNLVYNLLARLKGKATMVLISDDHNICGLAERFFNLENGKLEETQRNASSGYIRPYQELKI